MMILKGVIKGFESPNTYGQAHSPVPLKSLGPSLLNCKAIMWHYFRTDRCFLKLPGRD